MRQTAVIALIALIGSQALAGAYSLECSNRDNSIVISKSEISLKKDTGEKIEGVYFKDSGVELMNEFGADIFGFLAAPGTKFVIQRDFDNQGNASVAKILARKTFKDDCGHHGEETKMRQSVRIYDSSGTVLKKGTVLCTESSIVGHCS